MAPLNSYHSLTLRWLSKLKSDLVDERLGINIQLGRCTAFEHDVFHYGDSLFLEKYQNIGNQKSVVAIRKNIKGETKAEISLADVELKKYEDWTPRDVRNYLMNNPDFSKIPEEHLSKEPYLGSYVIYSHECPFSLLIESLERYFEIKTLDNMEYVWIDVFGESYSEMQNALTSDDPSLLESFIEDEIPNAISQFNRHVFVLESWPEFTTWRQKWCIWETFNVAMAERSIDIALPRSQYRLYIEDTIEDIQVVSARLGKVEVESALCESPWEKIINQAIERKSNFIAVNQKVNASLKLSAARDAMHLLQDQEGLEQVELFVRAHCSNNTATIFKEHGDYASAEIMLRRTVDIYKTIDSQLMNGQEHEHLTNQVARSLSASKNNLAVLLQELGRYAEAVPLMREALMVDMQVLGPEHTDVAIQMGNVGKLLQDMGKYSEAEPLLLQALNTFRRLNGERSPLTTSKMRSLASLYQDMGRYKEAEPLLRDALNMEKEIFGEDHANVALAMNSLGCLLQDMGNYIEAEPLFRESLRICISTEGAESSSAANRMNNLGLLLQNMGKYEEAEKLLREALKIDIRLFGSKNPSCSTSMNNLALLLQSLGRYDEAEPFFIESLEIDKGIFGPRHRNIGIDLNNLSRLIQDKGRYDEAEELLREALEIFRDVCGPEHQDVATCLLNLGTLYSDREQYDDAEVYVRQSLEIDKKTFGENHLFYAVGLYRLADVLSKKDNASLYIEEADSAIRKAMRIGLDSIRTKFHPRIARFYGTHAGVLKLQGRFKEAIASVQQAEEIDEKLVGKVHPVYALDLHIHASVIKAEEGPEGPNSKLIGKEAVEIAQKTLGEEHPVTLKYKKEWL